MQLLDQALLAAIAAKEVDPEHAYLYALDKRRSSASSPTPMLPRHGRIPSDLLGRLRDHAVAAIDAYLNQVLEKKGSDLHFLAGDPARVRQYGELKRCARTSWRPNGQTGAVRNHAEAGAGALRGEGRRDFAYTIPGVAVSASTSCGS
jgi:hypothetical protein